VKGDWDAWNARSLKDEPIIRLILDGTVVRVRLDKKATSISLLVALDRHVAPERGKSVLETRCAIDNDEFRRLQAAVDQIVEERPPGRLALSAHVLDRQQHLLAVLPDAQRAVSNGTGSINSS